MPTRISTWIKVFPWLDGHKCSLVKTHECHFILMCRTWIMPHNICRAAMEIQCHKFHRIWVYRCPNQRRITYSIPVCGAQRREHTHLGSLCVRVSPHITIWEMKTVSVVDAALYSCRYCSTTWVMLTENQTGWVIHCVPPKGRFCVCFFFSSAFYDSLNCACLSRLVQPTIKNTENNVLAFQ